MKYIISVLVLTLAGALFAWRGANQKVAAANQHIQQLKTTLEARALAISELKASGQRNERALVVLRQQVNAAGALAARRNQTITRLLNENEALRGWFQSPLPDDIIRLHTRPAFDKPDDYLRWLSESQQLSDTGKHPENER
ncbi:LysB family phage lysis regulatory protein [Rahnella variigena]|uniref:Rz-like lysis system protein LysB n=1 Tax=Rahnella variigena TaxID=574964 RepID=UPI00101CF18F|nr:Rz-like lysis system protein LysB [Rahnella variigena]RYJ16459.1 LysB family phage lysis regulatory protein [Rahnella variigena]